MTTENPDTTKLSKIFARTESGKELTPQSWQSLISDIFTFAKSCNALMLVSGKPGSGKTTFIKSLVDHKPAEIDLIPITHASAAPKPDWIIDAITPWLTSEKKPVQSVEEKMRSLAETNRPILVCIDSTASSTSDPTVTSILALLNLADSSNLKLSVLMTGNHECTVPFESEMRIQQRIMLNSELPAFDEAMMQSFVVRKLQMSNISHDQITPDVAAKICRDSRGIPGVAIQLLASAIGGVGAPLADNSRVKNVTTAPPAATSKKIDSHAENKKLHRIEDLLAPRKN